MKYTFILLCSLFLGCAVHSQHAQNILRIEFNSLARGGNYKQIVVTKDSVVTSIRENRGGELKTSGKPLTKKEWSGLLQTLENQSLAEIPDLKSPTMKRAYDGARNSEISITITDGTTFTHSFDDETPHEKLQKLMREINKLK